MTNFQLGIMTPDFDAWISEPIDEDAVAWFKDEIGLSREELFRILARAKEILQELYKHNDDILDLTYDTDGAWYINFAHSDPDV